MWTLDVDAQGRITKVDAGVVLDLGSHVEVDRSTEAINRLGAAAETSTPFW